MSYKEELTAERNDPTGVRMAVDGYLERVMGTTMEDLMQRPTFLEPQVRMCHAAIEQERQFICALILATLTTSEITRALDMLSECTQDVSRLLMILRQADDEDFFSKQYQEKVSRCTRMLSGIDIVREELDKVWVFKTKHH